MSALDRIAFYQNRRYEVPNKELAARLARRLIPLGNLGVKEHLADKK